MHMNRRNVGRKHLCDYYWNILKNSLRSFEFNNQKYRYFTHLYSATWKSERIVEIPIVLDYIRKNSHGKALEVGNVLAHYLPIDHVVVDKYELAPGVINQDIMKYNPKQKFDCIVSISAIEHIGFDEPQKDKYKPAKAIKKIQSLLTKKGKAIITFSLGYNKNLDKQLFTGELPFHKTYFLKRISSSNSWKQVGKNKVTKTRYNSPYPFGNVVAIGLIKSRT